MSTCVLKAMTPPGDHTCTVCRERSFEIYVPQTRYATTRHYRSRVAHEHLNTGRGELAPRHLRIYANHATIVDFEDAEVTKPQVDVTLQEGEVGITEYPLNTPAFANIHSLSVFFVSVILKPPE